MVEVPAPLTYGLETSNLAEVVYRRLREDILLGRLRPNELLVESELAERLSVSRTPVREGLQRLASEGMIVSRRRRWVVYEHSLDEIREIYEVRAGLEGFAARLASQRVSADQLRSIAEATRSRRLNMVRGDESMVETNERFHQLITKGAGNSRIESLIEHNRLFYFNNQVARLYREADIERSQAQHIALVEALEARDADRAEQIARHHVYAALDFILAHYEMTVR